MIAEQDQKQLFMVDYCKRGTTKCRKCKKKIPSAALRIGKSAKFRTRDIYHYFHVTCAFQSFEKARSSANTITCMDDILGFDLIRDDAPFRDNSGSFSIFKQPPDLVNPIEVLSHSER